VRISCSFIPLFIQNQRIGEIFRLVVLKLISEATVQIPLYEKEFCMSFIAKLKLVASKRERNLSPIIVA
jgi:hypothetical protein